MGRPLRPRTLQLVVLTIGMHWLACGGRGPDASTPPARSPTPAPAAPPPPSPRPGTQLTQARVCMDVDAANELAREGTTRRLRFPPCWCGETLTCEARA